MDDMFTPAATAYPSSGQMTVQQALHGVIPIASGHGYGNGCALGCGSAPGAGIIRGSETVHGAGMAIGGGGGNGQGCGEGFGDPTTCRGSLHSWQSGPMSPR